MGEVGTKDNIDRQSVDVAPQVKIENLGLSGDLVDENLDCNFWHSFIMSGKSKKAYPWLLKNLDDYGPIYDHITLYMPP